MGDVGDVAGLVGEYLEVMAGGFSFGVVEFWCVIPAVARHEGAVEYAVESWVEFFGCWCWW